MQNSEIKLTLILSQYNYNQQSVKFMRLDPTYLHFISKEELRILAAIQIGMRNHQYVTKELIARIGNLKGGQTFKTIQKLLKNKFIVHIGNKCDGYKLTYLGYDYLALNTFIKRGLIKQVIGKIGVGKQSDIYKCKNPDGDFVVLKLTRLGRNSFRSIKKNREYIQNRTSYNWLYLSRLSSIRQFLFMQLLHKYNFPVPTPIDCNRHGILMSLVDGDAFCRIQRISTQKQIKQLFETTLETLVNFAKHGLIHGDYNEFNIMVNEDGTKVTVIDFPQCISIKHPNAKSYFNRDVQCVYKYFEKLAEKSYSQYLKNKEEGDMGEKPFNVCDYPMPELDDIQAQKRLDHEIKTVGHITLEQYNLLEKYRSQEQRMRIQMEVYQQQVACEQQSDQGQQMSKEELESEEKQMKEYEDKLDLEKNHQMNEIGEIKGLQERQNYDQQLKNLIEDFQGKIQQPQFDEDVQQESSEQQQRFKGLTPYEIRIKIKQQKRVEREKKKAELTTNQLIKKSLKRGKKSQQIAGKGNHGTKDKVKQRNLEIKDTFWG